MGLHYVCRRQYSTYCAAFACLGVKSDREGTKDEIITTRIASLNSILWQKVAHIYETIMESTLTYGFETRQVDTKTENRLLSTEMDFPAIEDQSWKNVELRNKALCAQG